MKTSVRRGIVCVKESDFKFLNRGTTWLPGEKRFTFIYKSAVYFVDVD